MSAAGCSPWEGRRGDSDRQKGSQIDRQTDRQTEREADRQTDRKRGR